MPQRKNCGAYSHLAHVCCWREPACTLCRRWCRPCDVVNLFFFVRGCAAASRASFCCRRRWHCLVKFGVDDGDADTTTQLSDETDSVASTDGGGPQKKRRVREPRLVCRSRGDIVPRRLSIGASSQRIDPAVSPSHQPHTRTYVAPPRPFCVPHSHRLSSLFLSHLWPFFF